MLERVIAALLRAVLRATLLPTFRAGRPIAEQRRRLELITRLTLPARGVDYTAAHCGGVPGEFVRARGGGPSPHAILYLHGGAYCVGSPRTHRALTSHLARHADLGLRMSVLRGTSETRGDRHDLSSCPNFHGS